MKPQPPAISGMIVKRIIARRRRQERKAQFESDLEDLTLEEQLEESLRKVEKADLPMTFSGTAMSLDEWRMQLFLTLLSLKFNLTPSSRSAHPPEH